VDSNRVRSIHGRVPAEPGVVKLMLCVCSCSSALWCARSRFAHSPVELWSYSSSPSSISENDLESRFVSRRHRRRPYFFDVHLTLCRKNLLSFVVKYEHLRQAKPSWIRSMRWISEPWSRGNINLLRSMIKHAEVLTPRLRVHEPEKGLWLNTASSGITLIKAQTNFVGLYYNPFNPSSSRKHED
jgi:hypothetical protein